MPILKAPRRLDVANLASQLPEALQKPVAEIGQFLLDASGASDPAVAAMSLAGPLGMATTPLGKAVMLSDEDRSMLHDLLGKTIQLGKRTVRLSSVDPAKNTAILHDATAGERMATPIDHFLQMWRTIGEDPNVPMDPFPEGAVLSEPGTRAGAGTIGPRGGVSPLKRTIPKGSTR